MAKLFGRERELALIEQGLAGARVASGSLMLLKGEPGIGKSTLGREAVTRAADAGMRVLSGRCWEGGGAPPYWPWVQVFRELGSTPFESLVRGERGDSSQQRFQLFDAATCVLKAGAAKDPCLIFLDDLHDADLPSLLLLLFLSRQLSAASLFVLGTSRDVEPRLSADVEHVLGKVAREGELISLSRFTRDDVAAWIAQSERPDDDADDVFRITEGNPLFMHELLRVGVRQESARSSEGIKVALDDHLRKLSEESRALLEAASVLGREFGSRELAELANRPHDAVLEHLERATELRVLELIARERFQFTHGLLRDRLNDTLPPQRRSELNWRAGMVAGAHGGDPARVANHLLEGASAGEPNQAAAAALCAARVALTGLAFEAAVALAERGLAALGASQSQLVCELESTCGEGLIRSGSDDAGRARCVRAADMAKVLGCAEALANAALIYGSELTDASRVDPVMVRLLEEALVALGSEDSTLGAKVGVRLAVALKPPRSEQQVERVLNLARRSLAMGRRLADADTLLYVLEFGRYALSYLVSSDERFELTREAIALAQLLDQRLSLLKLGPAYAVALLERGLRADADAALAALVELHAGLDYPQSRWRLPMLQAGFCFVSDRLDEAERLGDEALAMAEQARSNGAAMEWGVQRMALAIARQAPASMAPHAASLLLSAFKPSPVAGSFRAWLLAVSGRNEEACRELREAVAMGQGFPPLMIAAEACILLADREAAAGVAEQLALRAFGEPFFWGAVGAYAIGPTPRLRGELARILGRRDEARRYFEESVALCRRIGAPRFLSLSLAALEGLDTDGGSATSDGTLSYAPCPTKSSAPAPRPRVSLEREGDVWVVGGSSAPAFRLKDSKGLLYLSELLAHPSQDTHVLSLIGLEHRAGDAGPVLDARAKAAYKKRLEDLEERISEAEGFGDQQCADRAREELDALAKQLAQAVGLGGRDRRAASDVERARINVQRRIKDAIESIAQFDLELGRYLSATVKTGTYCCFTPVQPR